MSLEKQTFNLSENKTRWNNSTSQPQQCGKNVQLLTRTSQNCLNIHFQSVFMSINVLAYRLSRVLRANTFHDICAARSAVYHFSIKLIRLNIKVSFTGLLL